MGLIATLKRNKKVIAVSGGLFVSTFLFGALVIYPGEEEVSIGYGDVRVQDLDFEKRYNFIANTYATMEIPIEANEKLNSGIREELARKMISEEVHKEIAAELGVTVSNKEVTEYMEKHNFKNKDYDTLTQQHMVKDFLLKNAITQKLLKDTDYSDKEIQAYFEASKENYIKPASVEFEQVVFKNKKAADTLMAGFNKQTALTDFKESEEVIVFSGSMDKREESALSEQIFGLAVGEWSELVAVGEEYHLYKIIKKYEEGFYTYEEIEEQVVKDYMSDKATLRFQQLAEDILTKNPPYFEI